jgi:hypothetical protein
MNRIDFSAEINIIKDGKEKQFNLPFVCDNEIWIQLWTNGEELGHSIEIPISNATIKH